VVICKFIMCSLFGSVFLLDPEGVFRECFKIPLQITFFFLGGGGGGILLLEVFLFLLLWTFLVCCILDCLPLGEPVLCSCVLVMSSFYDKLCFFIFKRKKKCGYRMIQDII
jgi:hypothetical protein